MPTGFRCRGGRKGDLEGEVGSFSVDCGGHSEGGSESELSGSDECCGVAVLIASYRPPCVPFGLCEGDWIGCLNQYVYLGVDM